MLEEPLLPFLPVYKPLTRIKEIIPQKQPIMLHFSYSHIKSFLVIIPTTWSLSQPFKHNDAISYILPIKYSETVFLSPEVSDNK